MDKFKAMLGWGIRGLHGNSVLLQTFRPKGGGAGLYPCHVTLHSMLEIPACSCWLVRPLFGSACSGSGQVAQLHCKQTQRVVAVHVYVGAGIWGMRGPGLMGNADGLGCSHRLWDGHSKGGKGRSGEACQGM